MTFALVWTDGGVPTDFDGNGKSDVARKEIHSDDAFSWNLVNTHDVENVAHHEPEHGLSQAHCGDIFGTFANRRIHFAPRAVRDASYSGVQRSPTGTDIGGHGRNWGSWPNDERPAAPATSPAPAGASPAGAGRARRSGRPGPRVRPCHTRRSRTVAPVPD